MINVYPTRIEATDKDGDVLFVLSASDDRDCCTMHINSPILLSNANLEQVLTAVRSGVKMLGLED
jgi:hypothetical protein